MGFHTIAGSDAVYGLIAFDADGNERPEQTGLMSQTLIDKAVVDFKLRMSSSSAMAGRATSALPSTSTTGGSTRSCAPATGNATQVFPGFKPLLIGLHWPSLPGATRRSGQLLRGRWRGTRRRSAAGKHISTLGDSPKIRKPLEMIFAEARRNMAPESCRIAIREGLSRSQRGARLKSEGVDAPPERSRRLRSGDSYEAARGSPASSAATST